MPQSSINSIQATLERALPALSTRLGGQRLPFLVFLGLVVLIAWLAARLSWQFAAPPPVPGAGPGTNAVAGPAGGSPRAGNNLVDRITSAHLFGTASAPSASEAAANAPKTSLDLTLLGVAAGSDGIPSQAIIAHGSNSEQHTYSVGDSLPGGAVVHDIFPDRVVIAHDGRLESLPLPQPGTSILAANMHFGNGQALGMPSGQGGQRATLSVSPRLRQQIEQHPQALMQYLNPRPYRANGKLVGYKVYPGKKSQFFEESGLRPGDLVTRINGISLDSPADTAKAMAQLQHAHGTVQLEVQRHGNAVHISLNVPGG